MTAVVLLLVVFSLTLSGLLYRAHDKINRLETAKVQMDAAYRDDRRLLYDKLTIEKQLLSRAKAERDEYRRSLCFITNMATRKMANIGKRMVAEAHTGLNRGRNI